MSVFSSWDSNVRKSFPFFSTQKKNVVIPIGRNSCVYIIWVTVDNYDNFFGQFFSRFGHRGAPHVELYVLLTFPHHFVSIALLFGTTICSSLILSVPPPALASAIASVRILARSP